MISPVTELLIRRGSVFIIGPEYYLMCYDNM